MSDNENQGKKAPGSFATTRARNRPVNLQGSSGSSNSNAEIHDRTGLYISIIALALAGMAFGGAIMLPQIMDAKIAAAVAAAKESMAQQTADAKATAVAGNQHARVALDKVEDFRAKLAAKGIDVPPLDGH